MEEGVKSRPFFEDIPDLIHDIQLRLSAKEAARTSVLSKSWLHAWSTIPSLRFREGVWYAFVSKELKRELSKLVNRTLIRYLSDNIPVKIIDVVIDNENQESASFTVNCIRQMAIKSCLQELSLTIMDSTIMDSTIMDSRAPLTLPNEILSGKNLNKIRFLGLTSSQVHSVSMPSHPVIKCVSLREMHLQNVHISKEVVHEIFSTCRLLVKIGLLYCTGFNTLKVKNLGCLYELAIVSEYITSGDLEINDVPNIRLFEAKRLPFNLDSLRSVTELSLSGIKILDQAFVDILQSKFPLLESLTLHLDSWMCETFNFTCLALKRISIHLRQHIKPVNIKVYAPNLVFFSFDGLTMPSLLFPTTILELDEMMLDLLLLRPVDESFFLKMREALTFSRKCDIRISITKFDAIMPLEINIDDLRRRVTFPAINVQRLSFYTLREYKGIDGRSPFFDALFSICHPKHLVASGDLKSEQNYLSEFMVTEVMEKKTRKGYWGDYLKDVEIRRHPNKKWETLTNCGKSFPEGPALVPWVEFKLNWR